MPQTMKVTEFNPKTLGQGKHQFRLEVCESIFGTLSIDVGVIRGKSDGPTLVTISGVHGDEYGAIRTSAIIYQEIDPEKLAGTYISIPVANPPAFSQSVRNNPWDDTNLARVFPGDPNGNVTQRIAYYLLHNVISHGQMLIDMHTAGRSGLYAPLTRFFETSEPLHTVQVEAARAAGLGAMHYSKPPYVPGMVPPACNQLGVASFGIELGGSAYCTEAETSQYAAAVRNTFKHMGMLSGPLEKIGEPRMFTSMTYARAQHPGFMTPSATLLQEVNKGDMVATIADPFGQVLEDVKSPVKGRVLIIRTGHRLHLGDMVMAFSVEE